MTDKEIAVILTRTVLSHPTHAKSDVESAFKTYKDLFKEVSKFHNEIEDPEALEKFLK